MSDQRNLSALKLRVVGVYEGSELPEAVDVVKVLQVEQHPWGTGTATKRYYVLLVSGGAESQPGIPATLSLHLDDYEQANLRAGLEVLRKIGLDTGDWLGQILFKLPEIDRDPNESVENQLKRVRVPE